MDDTTGAAGQIAAAIAALEAQRALLGDAVVDLALAALRRSAAPLPLAPQQLKQVSVLFVDVVGSTAIGQQLGPEEIHAVMDGALERFTAIVRQQYGRVLQYTGDGMLAAFGAEETHEDDVERAVLAGLDIIEEARRLAPEARLRHGVPDFNIRAGVHTGTVLLGGGVDADGSIRGATVNVAARMEQSAPPGRLRISHDSWRHVRGLFDVDEQAPINVKGVEKPLRSYLVERVRPRAFRVPNRGIEGVHTTMVGREAELEALVDAFGAVLASSQSQAVTVVGDAGLGKSRLLAEFQHTLHAQTCWFLLGRAHPRSPQQPFGLLRDLLARQFAIGDADDAELARQKLVSGLAPLFVDEGDAPIHLIGQLIGLDFSASPHLQDLLDDERSLRDQAFRSAALCLRRMAGHRPVLLVLDDLHWADSGTLDFMQHLLPANADTALLCVFMTRPTQPDAQLDGLGTGPHRTRLELKPLDRDLSQQLAQGLLQRIARVPEALRSLVMGSAEGNPFYMEELVKMLIDDGVILTDGEAWQVQPDKLIEARVPPTLNGVLQARIDALAPPERLALQQAAVVGHVFWDRALVAINPAAANALPALLRKRLIVRHNLPAVDGAREFAFQHHLLQQVAYDGVLKPSRLSAHAKVGAFWSARAEVASPQDVDPAACRALADAQYHRCKADPEGFVRWLDTQFAHYLNAYAGQALRPLAEQMIGVCEQQFGPGHPETAKALTNLARVILLIGGVEKAEPLLHRAMAIQQQSLAADHPDAARTLAVLAGYYSVRGDHAAAQPLFRRALEIRQKVFGTDHPLTLNALEYLAKTTLELGDFAEAEALQRRVLAAKEARFGVDHPVTAWAMTALGEMLGKTGRYDDAAPLIRRALATQTTHLAADHPEAGLSMWHLAEVLRGLAQLDESEQLARRALQIWESNLGPVHEWTAWGLIGLAETRLAQGAAAEAAALADRAVDLVQGVYGPRHAVLGSTLNLHGRALLALGEFATAQPALQRALTIQCDLAPPGNETAQGTRDLLARAQTALAERAPG